MGKLRLEASKPGKDTHGRLQGGVFNDPQVVFRVHVEIAKLDEVRMIRVDKVRQCIELGRIISTTGQNKIVK